MGTPPPNPADMLYNAQRLAIGQQQFQSNQLALQEQIRAHQATLAIADAMKGAVNADGSMNMPVLAQAMASRGFGDQWPAIEKGLLAADKARADIRETQSKADVNQSTVQERRRDYLGGIASAIRATAGPDGNYDGQAFLGAVGLAINQGRVDPLDATSILQTLQKDPTQLKRLVDTAWLQSPEQQKLERERVTAEAAKQRAATGAEEFRAKMQALIPPSQAEAARIAEEKAAREQRAPLVKAQTAEAGARAGEAAATAKEKNLNVQMLSGLMPGGGGAAPKTPPPKIGDQRTYQGEMRRWNGRRWELVQPPR